MPGIGEAAGNAGEQASSNLKAGGGGGLAIALGSSVAGNTLGPIIGGTLAGSYIGGDDGDTVTQFGMMLGMFNALNGGGSGGSSRGRM